MAGAFFICSLFARYTHYKRLFLTDRICEHIDKENASKRICERLKENENAWEKTKREIL